MTKKYQLGRLEKVDLRRVWADEARDFTPWLAREENIALLSDAIGLDLEVEETEKGVGSFAADIVCRESGTEHQVLIESQFGETDHDHLGKLITYAAGLDAATIIWIAGDLREEHRAALDWLNDNTTKTVEFLGIEIELYCIGDSLPAPKFYIVSKPNKWTKATRQSSNLDRIRLEYWTRFCSLVEKRGGPVKPAEPRDSWIRHSVRPGFNLDMGNDSRKKTIHINVNLTEADYKELEKDKDLIALEAGGELEAGEKFEWRQRNSQIYLRKPSSDIWDRSSWPEQHEWLYDKLQLFHRVLTPRFEKIHD